FAAFALESREGRLAQAVGAVVLLGVAHGVGALLIDDAEYDETPFRVGILQSDFPLEMKWDGEYSHEMVRNAAMKSRTIASNMPVDLFVWPESLVMAPIETPEIFSEIRGLTLDTGVPLY